ncbi:MAG TPA: DUF255 domain-containing protein, partial [Verrucomicrobiae bacterium]|nr:DUF255 domain-containing protein [Verrucomicrobiae bacterium]
MHNDATMRIRELLTLDKTGFPADGGEGYNRLVFEKSPYLLQHAANPVKWYPWGEDAFQAARREDKPIFLSIGYATCHWCHVMEEESFEDPGVAEVINRHFIPIKVDREERPDVDEQYMLVSQMLTGGGGWPLNVIMTPDRRPFFAATYMPRESRPGLPSIVRVLENVAELWRTQRQAVEQSCASIVQALSQGIRRRSGDPPADHHSEAAFARLREMYDDRHGGFGEAPKFPMPHYLSFLVRYAASFASGSAADMALHTLRSMRLGGIYDQLGYGIHRYSVDGAWQVPHFEKMLYDQAMVADACWDACRYSGDPFFLRMGEEILEFVLREMSLPGGGFCSGLDA